MLKMKCYEFFYSALAEVILEIIFSLNNFIRKRSFSFSKLYTQRFLNTTDIVRSGTFKTYTRYSKFCNEKYQKRSHCK